jgi:hypothetical protein
MVQRVSEQVGQRIVFAGDELAFEQARATHRALAKVLHGLKRLTPKERVEVLLMALAIVRGERE